MNAPTGLREKRIPKSSHACSKSLAGPCPSRIFFKQRQGHEHHADVVAASEALHPNPFPSRSLLLSTHRASVSCAADRISNRPDPGLGASPEGVQGNGPATRRALSKWPSTPPLRHCIAINRCRYSYRQRKYSHPLTVPACIRIFDSMTMQAIHSQSYYTLNQIEVHHCCILCQGVSRR